MRSIDVEDVLISLVSTGDPFGTAASHVRRPRGRIPIDPSVWSGRRVLLTGNTGFKGLNHPQFLTAALRLHHWTCEPADERPFQVGSHSGTGASRHRSGPEGLRIRNVPGEATKALRHGSPPA